MARKPPGSIIRTLPDWNSRNMQAAAAIVGGIPNSTFAACGLYNNASDGSTLVVWHASVSYFPGLPGGQVASVFRGSFQQGPISNVGAGQGVLFQGQPQLAGQIFVANPYANPHTEFLSFPLYGATATATPMSWEWKHDWPLAYVPPTWSFVIDNDENGAVNCEIGFIWERVKDI